MSQLLFDRSIEITIGKRGQQGFIYKDLRVTFAVEKSLSNKPNKSTIKVYNLTKDNRSKAEQSGNVVVLRAGYADQLETIFTGDVAKAKTELDGNDYVTTFEMGDGEQLFQTAKIEQSFSKGTDIKDAITGILEKVGFKVGDISGIISEKLQGPLVLSGPVRKHLDDLAVRQNFEWSIQDDQIQVLQKGKPSKLEAVLVSPDTGLIGIPKNRFGKKDGGAEEKGIEFDILLNGKLKPGRIIVMSSKVFQGKYRLQKVVYSGDNFGQDFLCKCEAVPIK